MSYFKIIINPLLNRNIIRQLSKRYFLSNAFDCKDAWNNRLNQPIFKKINIESMYYELDSQYNKTKGLAPIDVDIFTNCQTDNSYLTEVEELIYRFRQTRLAHKTFPTTHHGFIRLFYDYKKDELIRILHDRLNYGIFPDEYLLCYLLDKYLKIEDYRNAAKVGCLQMFQEDYSQSLSRNLSLYAIHKYLLANVPWDDVVEEEKKDDDEEEEEVKVRVSYLRNPFFDDHFDLTDGQHICGKSLAMIANHLDDVAMSNSFKVLGLALYNKWEKLTNEMNRVIELQNNSQDCVIYKDALDFASKIIADKLKDDADLNKIQDLINQIKEKSCSTNNLLSDVENLVKETVKTSEPELISSQIKLYKEWNEMRESELKAHLLELQRKNRIEEIARKKVEMEEKEQLLYFFDNEEHINQVCQKKEEILQKRMRYQTEEQKENEYVPPEVQKRVTE